METPCSGEKTYIRRLFKTIKTKVKVKRNFTYLNFIFEMINKRRDKSDKKRRKRVSKVVIALRESSSSPDSLVAPDKRCIGESFLI